MVDGVRGIRMVGSATASPRDVSAAALCLDNAEVVALLGHDAVHAERAAEWGVERRQWLQRPGGPRSDCDIVDLAEAAARRALDRAELAIGAVDALFLATSTPPHITSSSAAKVSRRLGLATMAVELRGGGAGALQGVALACGSGAQRAVVVAADVLSALLDPNDPTMTMLYADAAAAVVLARDPGHPGGLVEARFGVAEVPGRPFTVPGGLPPTAAEIARGEYAFQRPDAAYLGSIARVWDHASDQLGAMLPPGARLAPYPVTRAIGLRAASRLGLPPSHLFAPLADYGCVGTAGVLVAWHAAREADPELPVGAIAVGGGVGWGALAWV